MIKINLPGDADKIKTLRIGDRVSLSGIIITGRDEVHRHLFNKYDKETAAILKGSFIYHCGPIVKKVEDKYKMICCGPTTSMREEPYQARIIKRYGIKGIIGKGGMGAGTLKALKEHGGVYLNATGGAAALLGQSVKRVLNVHFLEEFGVPEAMWILKVEDFPAIVTMDSNGGSLHKKTYDESMKRYKKIIEKI
jgi:fumarate hydratase class I